MQLYVRLDIRCRTSCSTELRLSPAAGCCCYYCCPRVTHKERRCEPLRAPRAPSPQQRSIGIHSLLLQTRLRTGRGEAASTAHGQLLNRCLVSWQTRKVTREGRLTGLQMRASCRRTNTPQMAEVRGQRGQRRQRGHQRTPDHARTPPCTRIRSKVCPLGRFGAPGRAAPGSFKAHGFVRLRAWAPEWNGTNRTGQRNRPRCYFQRSTPG